jgi:type 1 glutamine amidotransferase
MRHLRSYLLGLQIPGKMIKSLLVLLTIIAGFLVYSLSELKMLPWQHPVFDHILVSDQQHLEKCDILIFTKTNGFRHKSIEAGVQALTKEAQKRGWTVQATENGAYFNYQDLQSVKVVVFLSTTGNILTKAQKKAFENYMESGGGYVGIHSASDTEHHWDWYDHLLGTHFKSHTLIPSHIAEAEINTEIKNHLATKHLPDRWNKEDEWYNFKQNVRGIKNIQVLLSLNERSYHSIWPKRMGNDHPVSWTNLVGKGRMFYTGMGHTSKTFVDKYALEHIMGGVEWAGQF